MRGAYITVLAALAFPAIAVANEGSEKTKVQKPAVSKQAAHSHAGHSHAGHNHAAHSHAGHNHASHAHGAEAPEMPGEDVFGFTSTTDVGKSGDKGLALENDIASGTRFGRYRGLTQKLEFSRTFADNWSYAASVFGAWSSLKNNPDFDNRAGYGFDGFSVELRHRLIERTAANPFALTVAVEPRWSRIDSFSGLRSEAYSAEFKTQIDAPINDRWFWAMNANFGTGRARDPLDRSWSSESESVLSTAVAYAVEDEKFWVGVETRWQHVWNKAFFGTLEGQALYLGPTIAYKPSSTVTLSAVALPQISGKARGVSGPLDIDNFERANFRLKLAFSL